MKNVRNAHFWQVDHKIKNVFGTKEVIILPSPIAWQEFKWTKKYFEKKPKEGYFIWVKKTIKAPLFTCIAIFSPKISQNLKNLVVITKNIKAEIYSTCASTKKNLWGSHIGYSKIVLRENSELKIRHFHKWQKGDVVSSNTEFFLAREARLSYTYRCLAVPDTLKTKLTAFLDSRSSVNFEVAVLAKRGNVNMQDSTFLNGEKSRGTMRLRMVADKNSTISAQSKMIANNAGIGHLDCMGLLLAKNSQIDVVPELLNKNKNATLTHEASVGRISEEVLSYLRSRGLTEDEAIDLVVNGFLREEKPFIFKGVSSKDNM